MPAFQPVSQQRHASKRWQRYTDYAFAAKELAVPLVAGEVAKVALAMPIVFIEEAGRKHPMALLGLAPGRNLFVAPNGRWVGGYVPAFFRGYPFALAKAPDGEYVLCVAEDSGLVTDGPEGELFFGEEGKPVPAVNDVMKFLQQVEHSRQGARKATECLEKHGLLHAWPIMLKTPERERPIPGLFKVDEAALNALSADALHELQKTGALPLAFCQLLSMQHLPMLGKLAEVQVKAAQKLAAQQAKAASISPGRDLDLEFLNSETINFSGLAR